MMSSAANITMVRSQSADECLLLIRKNSITKRHSLPTVTKSLQPPSDPLECMSFKRFNSGVAAGEESQSAECVPNHDVSSYESCCNNDDDDDVFTDADSVDDYSDTSSNSTGNEESEDDDGDNLSMPSSCCGDDNNKKPTKNKPRRGISFNETVTIYAMEWMDPDARRGIVDARLIHSPYMRRVCQIEVAKLNLELFGQNSPYGDAQIKQSIFLDFFP